MDAAKRALHPDTSPLPQPETVQSSLELVPPAPLNPDRPAEQLPLLRMLEVVRDRVESLHAVQHYIAEGLKDIRANLPVQRRPLSKRTQELHILAVSTRRNGRSPCRQETPVCTDTGRLNGSEYDHYFGRSQNRVTQTWLVSQECNQRLLNSDFKTAARSSFESYQLALRPLLSRQTMMPLVEVAAKGK
jgi:hypothetical protein